MREPPAQVAEDHLLRAVRTHWDERIRSVAHLPVGFGAHHWAAHDASGAPLWFVTFDRLARPHAAERLEAAYAGAALLREQGLDVVVAPVRSAAGSHTVRFADGALSCTPWLRGTPGGELDLPWTTETLRRLHTRTPPPGLPPWQPLVGPDLADRTAELTRRGWGPGPHAVPAREEVRRHLADLARWTARYHALADVAGTRPWVATHGEPDQHNQLLTAGGRVLVDWESLRLAPAERDLRTLVDGGMPPTEAGADPDMLELFDLEWRLDEIAQFTAWFAAPHSGTEDDRIAFGGLLHELGRP